MKKTLLQLPALQMSHIGRASAALFLSAAIFIFLCNTERMTSKGTILTRSFSRRDQRNFGCFAFAVFLTIAALNNLDSIMPQVSSHIALLNLQLSMEVHQLNKLIRAKEMLESHQPYYEVRRGKLNCDFTRRRSDICEMNGDIRVHGNSSTIFLISSSQKSGDHSWNLKPYARKQDAAAMNKVRTVTIKTSQSNVPECSKKYSIPAIVFSAGGYGGNHYHAFFDILIPLYLTSVQFKGEVLLLLTDKHSWWTQKHQLLLQKFSNYEHVDMDQENEVLCFSRIIVGQNVTDKEPGIHPSQSSQTMKDFRRLIRSAYSLKRESIRSPTNDAGEKGKKPRLLLISRKATRRLLNEGEVAATAESIGFEVEVEETGSPESRVSRFVNSFDVLVGVHGAGLTNMVYLPDNALVIQIIPLGEMEWMARTYFEDPARDMNLQYLEYKISPNESSLLQQYPSHHDVLKDPGAIKKRGWLHFQSVYMLKQDVKIDISNFRQVLVKAYTLIQKVEKICS